MESNFEFEFVVRDRQLNVVFGVNKPTLEMLEEEIGRWERHNKEQNGEQTTNETAETN